MQIFSIEQFTGPLDLLLQMIENESLHISEISLSDICDQYVEYVQKCENEITMEELADFLLIATRLLRLKTKLLIPYLILEDDDEVSLEEQLKMFQLFREAADELARNDCGMPWSFGRYLPLAHRSITFLPDERVNVAMLAELFTRIIAGLPCIRLPQEILRKTMDIKQRLEEVRVLVRKLKKILFSQLTQSATSRHDIIVSFIALLELAKQQELILEQPTLGADIMIKNFK